MGELHGMGISKFHGQLGALHSAQLGKRRLLECWYFSRFKWINSNHYLAALKCHHCTDAKSRTAHKRDDVCDVLSRLTGYFTAQRPMLFGMHVLRQSWKGEWDSDVSQQRFTAQKRLETAVLADLGLCEFYVIRVCLVPRYTLASKGS